MTTDLIDIETVERHALNEMQQCDNCDGYATNDCIACNGTGGTPCPDTQTLALVGEIKRCRAEVERLIAEVRAFGDLLMSCGFKMRDGRLAVEHARAIADKGGKTR